MFRRPPLLLALPACVLALLAGSAAAEPLVKVSLSAEDPDVQALAGPQKGPIAFHLFVDGMGIRGVEFGLAVEGGETLTFAPGGEQAWVSMPMVNPYPGTIAQAKAGPDCLEPPVYLGKLLVQPDSPDGEVIVDVIPSMRAAHAMLLGCEYEVANGFRAFPAAVNGTEGSTKPHQVVGDNPVGPVDPEAIPRDARPGTAHDHSGHDHSAHDHGSHEGHEHP